MINFTSAAAAASDRYPNLTAALASPAPAERDADEIFASCVTRLIDGYLPAAPGS